MMWNQKFVKWVQGLISQLKLAISKTPRGYEVAEAQHGYIESEKKIRYGGMTMAPSQKLSYQVARYAATGISPEEQDAIEVVEMANGIEGWDY